MIKNEAECFGLLFLGDGATITRTPLLKMLVSGGNIIIVPGSRWNVIPTGTIIRLVLPARQRLKRPLE